MPRVLHLISQAHLDPVWLWPTADGVAEVLTTMQSAVDRCHEFPQFKFTRSSAQTYRWVQEIDPRLFAEIKALVAAKRWEIIGNWIEQPDCNLPSAESFRQQSRLGCGYFQREFGHASRIGYNPDSFGHAAGLPMLLKEGGMDYYACMRPSAENNPAIPLLFQWESPDGSRVLCQRIPTQYSQSYASTPDDIEERIRAAASGENYAPGFENGVFWFGVGNHGGGPTREHIERVLELQADDSLPELRFSFLQDYFDAVEQEAAYAELPVHQGELGYALRGSYSATAEVKRLNRAGEKALAVAATASEAAGSPANLDDAWWKLGFNQFHDILAGTCTEPTWKETRDRFGAVLHEAQEVARRAAFQIAREVDTSAEKESVLFAFNPLPFAREAHVALDHFVAPLGKRCISHLETQEGEKVPLQWTAADANFGPWGLPWGKLNARVSLPAAGYQVLRVVAGGEALDRDQAKGDPINQFKKKFEEQQKLVALPTEPALTSVVIGEENLLAAPVSLSVVKDSGDTWGQPDAVYDEVLGKPELVSVTLLEDGAVVKQVRQHLVWEQSTLFVDVLTFPGRPEVEVCLRFNWQQKRQLLRLIVPHAFGEAPVHASVPGAVITRPNDGNEYAMLDWLQVGAEGGASLLIANDGCSSYRSVEGRIEFLIARGTPFAEHHPFIYDERPDVRLTDQGWQEARFLLLPGEAELKAEAAQEAADAFQCPPIAMLDSVHPGTRGWTA